MQEGLGLFVDFLRLGGEVWVLGRGLLLGLSDEVEDLGLVYEGWLGVGLRSQLSEHSLVEDKYNNLILSKKESS